MRSAVCFSAPQLQFAEDTKPHLGIVQRNSPTPVRRRFSLTQKGLGRVILGGEGPGRLLLTTNKETEKET